MLAALRNFAVAFFAVLLADALCLAVGWSLYAGHEAEHDARLKQQIEAALREDRYAQQRAAEEKKYAKKKKAADQNGGRRGKTGR
jgi:hypothetical protein